LDCKSKRS